MKFGESVCNGPENGCLNFGSDMEHIRDIMYISQLAYITIHGTTKFPVSSLLSLSFLTVSKRHICGA